MTEWKKGAKYWTKQFNPVIGCSPVSEGCKNCWAKGFAERLKMTDDFSCRKLTGAKAPKSGIVFAGNMTDLFGEWNTKEEIISWLNSLSPKAVNLVLTKRAERMPKINLPDLRHIWYGITAENQARLEERIMPFSEATCCHIGRRWLSAEPILGPIDLERNIQIDNEDNEGYGVSAIKAFDWVVVGAESGPDSVRRSCKIEWVENIVEQCQSAGVPVFVKQLDIGGTLVKDISKFPSHLQLRQVPWGEKEGLK